MTLTFVCGTSVRNVAVTNSTAIPNAINTSFFATRLARHSANGLANARSMSKLGYLIMTGKVGGKKGMDIELPRLIDHGIGYNVSFTSAGYGHERFHVDGVHGWTGWAGIAGTVLQWNDEKDLAFAYNTALPYGRVGKPRGIQLMKTLERLVGEGKGG